MPNEVIEERPWGNYAILDDRVTHKVKRILVRPGHRLSYQRHARRSEHWFFLAGQGRFTLNDEVRTVSPGSATDIPAGSAHRIENCGDDDLVFVEVQFGDYFGEADIERLDDDYGRLATG
jgi:mannose-6-phosphate isomerase